MACQHLRIVVKERGGGTLGVQHGNGQRREKYQKEGATEGAVFCQRERTVCSECESTNRNCPEFKLLELR